MRMALDKVAFLPFGLLVDQYRWKVFSGEITPASYNKGWWDLRRQYQGVAPASPRGEEFFDPGAKYHVPANVPYTRYFLAHVLQFQFHRALCREAGFTGPLHQCSIYGNKAAGAKLNAMLEMGMSRPVAGSAPGHDRRAAGGRHRDARLLQAAEGVAGRAEQGARGGLEVILALALAAALAASPAPLVPDPPHPCEECPKWNEPRAPYRVFGNTYYVGTAGISAFLVTSPEGHVLLDGGLTQSAPRIDESIRALGFKPSDVKLILSSHAHFDHAGGIAALARATGATVAASARGARDLETGGPAPDDPLFAQGQAFMGFPPVRGVRRLADGETLSVGPIAVTAHVTPGHTPGQHDVDVALVRRRALRERRVRRQRLPRRRPGLPLHGRAGGGLPRGAGRRSRRCPATCC